MNAIELVRWLPGGATQRDPFSCKRDRKSRVSLGLVALSLGTPRIARYMPVVSGHSRVNPEAVFGDFNARQSFATRKPLIRRDQQFVARLTLCATMNDRFGADRQAAGGQYRKFSGFNWLSRSCPSNDFPFLTDPRGLGTRDRAAARHSVGRPRVADCSSNRLRKCDAVPIALAPDARTLFISWLPGFVSVSLAGRAKSN